MQTELDILISLRRDFDLFITKINETNIEKQLTDIDICRLLNIPQMTFKEWKKKNKDDWRYTVYHFFKNMSQNEIKMVLNRNKR